MAMSMLDRAGVQASGQTVMWHTRMLACTAQSRTACAPPCVPQPLPFGLERALSTPPDGDPVYPGGPIFNFMVGVMRERVCVWACHRTRRLWPQRVLLKWKVLPQRIPTPSKALPRPSLPQLFVGLWTLCLALYLLDETC